MRALSQATRAAAATQSNPQAVSSKADIANAVDVYIRKHGITQITRIPPMELAGIAFAEQFTVVIGNNRYHGATVAEAVAQSTMTFDERFAA